MWLLLFCEKRNKEPLDGVDFNFNMLTMFTRARLSSSRQVGVVYNAVPRLGFALPGACHRLWNHCRRALPRHARPYPCAVHVRILYPVGLRGLYPISVHRQSIPLPLRNKHSRLHTLSLFIYAVMIDDIEKTITKP